MKRNPEAGIGGAEMPRTQTLRGFGMGAQHDPRAGVFLPRKGEHLEEPRPVRAAGRDRRVAAHLVHHQHVARRRRVEIKPRGGILRQVRFLHPRDSGARVGQQRVVVQRMRQKQRFKFRRP